MPFFCLGEWFIGGFVSTIVGVTINLKSVVVGGRKGIMVFTQ